MIFNEEQKLFMESAWLLYNNRSHILSNPCMAYAPISMPNGLMFCGDKAFRGATIGVYLEWWQECFSRMFLLEKEKTNYSAGQKTLS